MGGDTVENINKQIYEAIKNARQMLDVSIKVANKKFEESVDNARMKFEESIASSKHILDTSVNIAKQALEDSINETKVHLVESDETSLLDKIKEETIDETFSDCTVDNINTRKRQIDLYSGSSDSVSCQQTTKEATPGLEPSIRKTSESMQKNDDSTSCKQSMNLTLPSENDKSNSNWSTSSTSKCRKNISVKLVPSEDFDEALPRDHSPNFGVHLQEQDRNHLTGPESNFFGHPSLINTLPNVTGSQLFHPKPLSVNMFPTRESVIFPKPLMINGPGVRNDNLVNARNVHSQASDESLSTNPTQLQQHLHGQPCINSVVLPNDNFQDMTGVVPSLPSNQSNFLAVAGEVSDIVSIETANSQQQKTTQQQGGKKTKKFTSKNQRKRYYKYAHLTKKRKANSKNDSEKANLNNDSKKAG